MEDLLSARTPNPQKKENNTIKRKLQILDGLATSGKEFTEFCQEYNKINLNNPLDVAKLVKWRDRAKVEDWEGFITWANDAEKRSAKRGPRGGGTS